MYHGNITDNKASGGAGGGIYVNAENANEKVVMLSGAIESRTYFWWRHGGTKRIGP